VAYFMVSVDKPGDNKAFAEKDRQTSQPSIPEDGRERIR
jgi:hypothetical protein